MILLFTCIKLVLQVSALINPPTPLSLLYLQSHMPLLDLLLLLLADNDVVCKHKQVVRLLLDFILAQQLLLHMQSRKEATPLQLTAGRYDRERLQLAKV